MKDFLYVFIGGGCGSVLRFMVSLFGRHIALDPRCQTALPWPTLLVNILGCFLIGLFYKHAEQWGMSPEMRLLLTTGLCGGFTTFSTFSYEGITLLQSGLYGTYALYLGLSIILGLIAAMIPSLL